VHEPFQGVDSPETHIELVRTELVNGLAEPVRDLTLLGKVFRLFTIEGVVAA
jgi:hypothetical protein